MAKTKKPIANVKSKLNTKRTIKSVNAKKKTKASKDKSLSPVVMKSKARVSKQSENIESPKKGRGRPPKSLEPSPPVPNEKSKNTKAVERVIDIQEIKQHAQKILKEKKQNSLLLETASARASLRNRPLSSPVSPPKGRGQPKVIQTISDGPTVSLLSQNKVIQKSLPKNLKKVQKELLKKQKPGKAKTGKNVEKLKKSLVSAPKKDELEKLRNLKIIDKLSKVLLKKKVLTKVQLKALMRGQSEFKTITLFAGLLKQSKKAVMDGTLQGPKNQWNVSSKEDEEEEEEEDASYEVVDDEDRDKTYEPPIEEQAAPSPQFRKLSNAVSSTPLPATKSYTPKSKIPTTFYRKRNHLAEGSPLLYPVDTLDSIKKLAHSDRPIYLTERQSAGQSQDGSMITQYDSAEPEESVQSISALLEQTKDTTSANQDQEDGSSNRTEENEPPRPELFCEVCQRSFKQRTTASCGENDSDNLKIHLSSWLHKFNTNAQLHKSVTDTQQASRDNKKMKLIHSIKQEMIKNMAAQINFNDSVKGGSPLRRLNIDGGHKYILDSELNFSLVVDSLNLILTNDIEDDEDAYDTLQMAIGASEADMEVLKDLAGQTIIADYVYDNNNPESNADIFDPNESALLIEDFRHDQVDIDMETRAMGCPSTECNRTFFGLVGLQTHIKYYHRNEVFLQKKTSFRYLFGPEPLKYVCIVCKEMFPSSQDRDEHMQNKHVVNETRNNEAKAKLVDAFREILEFTLRKCVANADARKKRSLEGKSGKFAAGKSHEGEKVERIDVNGEKVGDESEDQDDEYDELTLLGANFVRKLRVTEDGRRAYDLLVQLVNPTEENTEFVNLLIVKLHTILGKIVRSTLLPISNQMVISSRQQHNVFNSDSRERPFICPICGLRFLNHVMRNNHLRAHPQVNVNVMPLRDEVIDLSVCVQGTVSEEVTELSRPATPDKTTLSKASVLNELKVRMRGKIEKRMRAEKAARGRLDKIIFDEAARDLANEEEMLAIEAEYLKVQEEELEQQYLDLLQKNKAMEPQSDQSRIQQVIYEIQSSFATPTPPPIKFPSRPFLKVNNNFKCLQCDRIFIREDEVYHHNRLEHADKSLASKLDDIRKKSEGSPSESDALMSSTGMSPIKPVEIITAPGTAAQTPSPVVEDGKQLAPLLTRKELEKVPVMFEKKTRSQKPDSPGVPNEDSVEDDDGNVSKVVKIGSKELVLQRMAKGSRVAASPRRIIKDAQGRVDRVVQRDIACLIEFDQASPVKITNLEEKSPVKAKSRGETVVSTPCNSCDVPPGAGVVRSTRINPPTAPIIKTPLASKLVSKLRSEINRKLTQSPLSVGAPCSSGEESQMSPSQVRLGTLNEATQLKRGPRVEEIPDEVRLSALAQLRALTAQAQEQKRKRRKVHEEDESEAELEEVCEDGGVLLTNSSNWKRVAEVEKDWVTSDEEEEEEVHTTRATRAKRRS